MEMTILNALLVDYVGGQLQVYNPVECYFYFGEIEKAWTDEKGLHVRLRTFTRVGRDGNLYPDPDLNYEVRTALFGHRCHHDDGRITYSVPDCGEFGTIIPPVRIKIKVGDPGLEPTA